MPCRSCHWVINKHGVHTFANEQLGLTERERDESTHYPVFMRRWATNIPGGTRAVLRSDAAQTRRLFERNNKERAQAPTTPGPSHNPRGGPDSKYSLSGKAADRLTHEPSLPIRCFPVTRRSVRLVCPVTPKVWPRMEHILEALTFYLSLFLTGGDMAKWWGLNRYRWSEHVDWEDAQEAEFRELFDDMTNDGWFSD